MSHDFFVALRDDRPRARDFDAVFGRHDRIPVRSPIPERARLPGFENGTPIYLLALDQITAEERGRLIDFLAARFGLDRADVSARLDDEGVPILAEDCTTIVHNPQRWFD